MVHNYYYCMIPEVCGSAYRHSLATARLYGVKHTGRRSCHLDRGSESQLGDSKSSSLQMKSFEIFIASSTSAIREDHSPLAGVVASRC